MPGVTRRNAVLVMVTYLLSGGRETLGTFRPGRTFPALQVTARTQLDALAATLTGIQRQRVIAARRRIFHRGKANRIAVHGTLLAIEAKAAGKTTRGFVQGLFAADRLVDLEIRLCQPLILRLPRMIASALFIEKIGFDARTANSAVM